jgi:acetylornithine/N-succinyldiaminopimelate aminotransferase
MKLFPVYSLQNLTLEKGKDCYVFDNEGNSYLDLYGGHAVISIGHTHPHYVSRITKQVESLGFYSNSVHLPIQQELADKLGEVSGLDSYSLFLVNSGAEATENALKLASFTTNRRKIIAFNNAFHGRTHGAVIITDSKKIKAPINDDKDVIFLPLNDVQALKDTFKKHGEEIAGVIVETIQGIGGIYLANGDFLETIQELCKKYKSIFIADEIQCGYGRTGDFFAFQHYPNIQPNIITMAKGMGNGFPVGGVLIHPSIEAWVGMLGTTFGGNPLACAASLAVLEVIQNEKLMSNAIEVGNYCMEEAKKLTPTPLVRGRGLMIAIEFDFPIAKIRNQLAQEHRILTGNASNPNIIRILPPLTVTKEEISNFIVALQKVLKTN